MSDLVIKVNQLGKRYLIGHEKAESYTALRDVVTNNVRDFGKGIKKLFTSENSHIQGDTIEEFWALKDLDFEIRRGDAVGIIGRNGAGKSTLLKLLSRITEPTIGRIEISGRMASLLEVGTGFHPELTGRENIFLNGAILGMSRSEIRSKFDEIVEFSGVEKFLDTPVKRYSSGMYVRLAFAVAAHLESEILIVDEVLAVGDSEFQKKCLGKMGEVSKGGEKTVLFVSHNMLATKQLCNKGIFLENGKIKMTGDVNEVIENYSTWEVEENQFHPIKINDIGITVRSIKLNAEQNSLIEPMKPFVIDIDIQAERDIDKVGIELLITHTDVNGIVFATNTKTRKSLDIKLKAGDNKISCVIESFNLCSGKYTLGFGIDLPFVLFYYYERNLMSFVVEEVVNPPSLIPSLPAYGRVYLDHEWISSY